MLNLLIPYFGYSPWIIHRLDMRTSGALCFATASEPSLGHESRWNTGHPYSTVSRSHAVSCLLPKYVLMRITRSRRQ